VKTVVHCGQNAGTCHVKAGVAFYIQTATSHTAWFLMFSTQGRSEYQRAMNSEYLWFEQPLEDLLSLLKGVTIFISASIHLYMMHLNKRRSFLLTYTFSLKTHNYIAVDTSSSSKEKVFGICAHGSTIVACASVYLFREPAHLLESVLDKKHTLQFCI
jgi:hypothetical protein